MSTRFLTIPIFSSVAFYGSTSGSVNLNSSSTASGNLIIPNPYSGTSDIIATQAWVSGQGYSSGSNANAASLGGLPASYYAPIVSPSFGGTVNLGSQVATGSVAWAMNSPCPASFVNASVGWYGSFYDTTTQTATNASISYPITLNTTAEGIGVRINASSTSQIIFDHPGVYNIQFSAQVGATKNGAFNFWLRKNGTDLPQSSGQIQTSNQDPYQIPAWNYVMTLAASDYLEFIWMSNIAGAQLISQASVAGVPGSSSAQPAIPSMIVTAQLVSYALIPASVTYATNAGNTASLGGQASTYYYPAASITSASVAYATNSGTSTFSNNSASLGGQASTYYYPSSSITTASVAYATNSGTSTFANNSASLGGQASTYYYPAASITTASVAYATNAVNSASLGGQASTYYAPSANPTLTGSINIGILGGTSGSLIFNNNTGSVASFPIAATASSATGASTTQITFVMATGQTSGSIQLPQANGIQVPLVSTTGATGLSSKGLQSPYIYPGVNTYSAGSGLYLSPTATQNGNASIYFPALTSGTSDTVVTLAATQTLTAKTLTSPTINSPTITTPTITSITNTGTLTLPVTTGVVMATQFKYASATVSSSGPAASISNFVSATMAANKQYKFEYNVFAQTGSANASVTFLLNIAGISAGGAMLTSPVGITPYQSLISGSNAISTSAFAASGVTYPFKIEGFIAASATGAASLTFYPTASISTASVLPTSWVNFIEVT